MFTATTLAQEIAKRPEVPIVIEASSDVDACNATGIVTGLDPHGDGFLAVKSAPALQSLRIDKLHNGEQVYICTPRRACVHLQIDRSCSWNSICRKGD